MKSILTPRLSIRGPRVCVLSSLLAVGACAGSTLRSGVGDAHLAHPPWYAGAPVSAGTEPIAHLPISYERGASQPASFEPAASAGTPVAALLSDMNAYLDSLGATVRFSSRGSSVGTPPNVIFGCETDVSGECRAPEGSAGVFGGDDLRLRLAVARPSAPWTTWARAGLDSTKASRLLLITLEIGQQWTRQRNLAGQKEVELGTGYSVGVPWLTSLETPVSVLRLTGALIGLDGRAVRIGAEGLMARRTPLLVSALGAQGLLSDEDVQQVRSLRREDLQGRPLVWQAALRHLVAQLTGREDLTPR